MLIEPTFDDLRRWYREAIAEAVRISIEELDRPQTLVLGESERSDSAMAVAYHLGETTVVRCDPDLVASLNPLVDPTRGLDSETFTARAEELGLGFVNGGDQRVVPMAELVDQPQAEGVHLRILDPDSPADRLPLYRNNWDRPASAALARSLGFRLVAQLTAVGRVQPKISDD
ncbi:MAG: hypothetical protein OEW83_15845 [Acidimicrobiia bacterium]|nr:hypothetical protein [Acidimicrobiia bacterium]